MSEEFKRVKALLDGIENKMRKILETVDYSQLNKMEEEYILNYELSAIEYK